MAQLGWIAGPISTIIMAIVAVVSSHLLSDFNRSPDPEYGPIKHYSYQHAVKMNLGKRSGSICSFFIFEAFYGFAIAYAITSAIR